MSALVLASGSPRRREILGQLGLRFDVAPSDVDETMSEGESATAYASRLARAKAVEVSARRAGDWVLGADTIVVVDGEVLGKPADDAAARGMLKMLAGRAHAAIAAVALARGGAVVDAVVVRTEVHVRPIDLATLERYVLTGEGRDKAGAYAVQGLAAGFVTEIRGSYTNVVGLPAAETLALLEKHGAVSGWPS